MTGDKIYTATYTSKIILTLPSQSNTLTYTGNAQTPTWSVSTTNFTIGGTTSGTNVNSYTATFTPKSGYCWSDGTATEKSVTWQIIPAQVSKPTENNTTFTYTASQQTYLPDNYNNIKDLVNITNNTRTNVGSQTVTVSLIDKSNYVWATDLNTTDKTFEFIIGKAQLTIKAVDKTMIYNGIAPTFSYTTTGLLGSDTLSGTATYVVRNSNEDVTNSLSTQNVGDYTIYVSGLSNNNYDITFSNGRLRITRLGINIPSSPVASYVYTGSAIAHGYTAPVGTTIVTTGTDETATNVGIYEIELALDGNHKWIDDSTENKTVTWTITQANGHVSVQHSSLTGNYPNNVTNTVTSNHGGTLSVSSTTGATASISGSTITVSPTQTGIVTITVTCAATQNYTSATRTFTVSFETGVISYTASGYTGVYDAQAHGISVTSTTDGAVIRYSESNSNYTLTASPKYANVGTYTVYYQITATGYNTVTGSEKVVITPATLVLGTDFTVTAYNGTYDGNEHYATITSKTTGLTIVSGISDSYGNNITSTNLLPGKRQVGSQTVYYKVSKANYNDYTGTTTITINNATLANPTNLKWSDGDLTTATWTAPASVNGITIKYTAKLLRDGSEVKVYENINTTSYDFKSDITTSGSYAFRVTAMSSNTANCSNSSAVTSDARAITKVTLTSNNSTSASPRLSGASANIENISTSNIGATYLVLNNNQYTFTANVSEGNELVDVSGSGLNILGASTNVESKVNINSNEDIDIVARYHAAYVITVSSNNDTDTFDVVSTNATDTSNKVIQTADPNRYIVAAGANVQVKVNKSDENKSIYGFRYKKNGESQYYTELANANEVFTTQSDNTYKIDPTVKIVDLQVKLYEVVALDFSYDSLVGLGYELYEGDTITITSAEGFSNIIEIGSNSTIDVYSSTWTITLPESGSLDAISASELSSVFGGIEIDDSLNFIIN